MDSRDDVFVPDDPTLYGPDPQKQSRRPRPLRESIGLTGTQFALVVGLSLLIFAFAGGPFWSAPRAAFPLRLFSSYLVIPFLVIPLLWWNRTTSVHTVIAASAAAAAVKFVVTVVIDVAHGLVRHWPP